MSHTPFDYAKSVTHTKESLYDMEVMFEKEYIPFMVNRSLSNSPQTVLFADAMNQYQNLDKKLQYDFYMYGIPKQRGYTKWVKKEELDIPQDHIDYICQTLGVGIPRAIQLYKFIGPEKVNEELSKRGGKVK